MHAHTWRRGSEVTPLIPFGLSSDRRSRVATKSDLSKDRPGEAWFEKLVLSQVEGLTTSGNDEAEHDDRV